MTREEQGGMLRGVKLAITVGILLVTAGILVPVVRTTHIRSSLSRAAEDMERIASGVRSFARDTGLPPARGKDGSDGVLYRLCGPGQLHYSAYFADDQRQGFLEDHLVRNQPTGSDGGAYEGWRGPYVEGLTEDPWGNAYVLVLYPMFLDDERDVIVVCSGPNGVMDGSYRSPRDVVPGGDDVVVVVYDKSPEHRDPIVTLPQGD